MTQPAVTRLADYQPPTYRAQDVSLHFHLDPARTLVEATMRLEATGAPTGELKLDGRGLELISLEVDGATLPADQYEVGPRSLTLFNPPERFTLKVVTACAPAENTALEGLYVSNGMFCTQCEAEGFRRITYYLDRPDVMATFSVRIEADKADYPVLLSNGNPGPAGDLPGGRHFAEWRDPFPKPSYLFALVAGDLACVEDAFTTQSGRTVPLHVFVQHQNQDKCAYTLDALKRAMRWDEETFGREYDLDVFMIVAVDHFNMGAMENKGLNVFNSAYVLAKPETATDLDYELIESIVAHEYFHNWTGNRITCRDWFQLSLKEGLTVFRDQEFSADQRSRPVQRIRDVRRLRARQFTEDDGPLAHPVQPQSYSAIDNFYTATVYEKGAEVIRMMQTLLGREKFRAGLDIYFARFDGSAATVEDLVRCMEEAGDVDLSQFRLWYRQAGTPRVFVDDAYDPDREELTIRLRQETPPTPGQEQKEPLSIPIRYGLVSGEEGDARDALTVLSARETTIVEENLKTRPTLSILRAFSAPVRVVRDLDGAERTALMSGDTDPFNRWEASRSFAMALLKTDASAGGAPATDGDILAFADALAASLADETLEPAYRAELLALPSEMEIALSLEQIDPEAVSAARSRLRRAVAGRLDGLLRDIYHRFASNAPYSPDADAAGRRALRNTALDMLLALNDDATAALATEQAASAANMTDEAAAVSALARSGRPEREGALAAFYEKWRAEPLIVNKWLGWRAASPSADALQTVKELMAHEAFDI
ncbi:MAG: aminopeptidase N, partial [Pseudomonadota bacterium]